MALNVTTAEIGSSCRRANAAPSLVQWDRGQILKITGVTLPGSYNVEFCCQGDAETTTMIGGANGVQVPNALLERGIPIIAYLVLHEGQDDRETEYWITISVKQRPQPPEVDPDPEQESVIDQLIAALNTGVEAAAASAQDAEDAAEAARLISETYVTPELFGAVGDGVTDDTEAIQNAINSGASLVVLSKGYATTGTITINRTMTLINTGSITYSGSGSAIKIASLLRCSLHVGSVSARNGTAIEIYASTYDENGTKNRVQYLDLYLGTISASDKCIYLNLDVTSGQDPAGIGWVNEIRIFNGRLSSGSYGIYGDAKGYQKMNNIKVYNTGIEGVTTGIYMANGCRRWSFNNLRYAESFTTLMQTVGEVVDFAFYGAQTINFAGKLNLSNQTSGIFRVPIYANGSLVSGETAVYNGVIRGLWDTVDSLMIKETVTCLSEGFVHISDGAKNIPLAVTTTGDINVYGKNLCPTATANLTRAGERTKTIKFPKVSGTLTFSWICETNITNPAYAKAQIFFSDNTREEANHNVGHLTVTTPEGETIDHVYLFISSGATEEKYANFTNLMLEYGSENTVFVAYNKQTRAAGEATALYSNNGQNTFECEADATITYAADPKLYIEGQIS